MLNWSVAQYRTCAKLSEAPTSGPELQIKGVAGNGVNHVENKVV